MHCTCPLRTWLLSCSWLLLPAGCIELAPLPTSIARPDGGGDGGSAETEGQSSEGEGEGAVGEGEGETEGTPGEGEGEGEGLPGEGEGEGLPGEGEGEGQVVDRCAGVRCEPVTPCTTGRCDPANGECRWEAAEAGAPCQSPWWCPTTPQSCSGSGTGVEHCLCPCAESGRLHIEAEGRNLGVVTEQEVFRLVGPDCGLDVLLRASCATDWVERGAALRDCRDTPIEVQRQRPCSASRADWDWYLQVRAATSWWAARDAGLFTSMSYAMSDSHGLELLRWTHWWARPIAYQPAWGQCEAQEVVTYRGNDSFRALIDLEVEGLGIAYPMQATVVWPGHLARTVTSAASWDPTLPVDDWGAGHYELRMPCVDEPTRDALNAVVLDRWAADAEGHTRNSSLILRQNGDQNRSRIDFFDGWVTASQVDDGYCELTVEFASARTTAN